MSHRKLLRRSYGRPAAILLTIAALAFAASGPTLASASTGQAPAVGAAASSAAKPTIVLVHGAFADASGWSAVISGCRPTATQSSLPPNPLRGLTVRRRLHPLSVSPPSPVPSSWSATPTAAPSSPTPPGAPTNVKALVYVAAFVPDAGDSVATSYDPTAYPGSLLTQQALVVRPTVNPSAPGGQDADLYIRSDLFRQVFAGDQSRSTAAVMAAAQRPLSAFAFTEASGVPAWKTLPSWDLITLDDRAISPGGQRFMAERAGAHITTVHSAHDVMISHPHRVVRLIEHVATQVG